MANYSVPPSDSTSHKSLKAEHGFSLCLGEVLVSLMNYVDITDIPSTWCHSKGSMVKSNMEKKRRAGGPFHEIIM